VADAHVRPSSMARPLPVKPKGMRKQGRGARHRPCGGAAPRVNERKAMITFLLLITIPTLLILNGLEKRRSRRKVSLDGFKMINGQIVFRRRS
jgi:hypothetical protein